MPALSRPTVHHTIQSPNPRPQKPKLPITLILTCLMTAGLAGLGYGLYRNYHRSAPDPTTPTAIVEIPPTPVPTAPPTPVPTTPPTPVRSTPPTHITTPPTPVSPTTPPPPPPAIALPPDPDTLAPISLAVTNGTLDDVARALSAQLGVRFGSDPNPPATRFTFTFQNAPLPEVQQALATQRIFWSSAAHVLKISDSIGTYQFAPPHAGISILLSAPRAVGSPAAPTYSSSFAVSADPRIEVVKARAPKFDPITDDQSGRWQARVPVNDAIGFSSWEELAFTHVINFQRQSAAPTPAPAKPASFTAITGTLSIIQLLESQTATINGPQNNLDHPVSAGPFEFTLTRTNNASALMIRRTGDLSVDPSLQLSILVIDNTETAWGIASAMPPAGQSRTIAIPPNFPKLEQLARIQIRVPTKTRDLTIPFEFKPVKLP